MPAKREAKKHRRAEKQGRRESRLNGREPQPTKRPDEVFMTFKQTYHDHFCASLNGDLWIRLRKLHYAEHKLVYFEVLRRG